jgi:hypothetical protein
MVEVKEILAAVKRGEEVSFQRVCEACEDMNDFRGNHALKKQMRDLRDKMLSNAHSKGLWA